MSAREQPATVGAHFSNALTKPLPASPFSRNTPRRIFPSQSGETLHLPRERPCSAACALIPVSALCCGLLGRGRIAIADASWLSGSSKTCILGGEHASSTALALQASLTAIFENESIRIELSVCRDTGRLSSCVLESFIAFDNRSLEAFEWPSRECASFVGKSNSLPVARYSWEL